MKTKTLLFLLCLFLTGTLLAQTTVTWGENNTRTDTRDNGGQYGSGIMSGFYLSPAPWSGTYPPGATSNPCMHLLDVRHSNPANNYAMQFAHIF